MDGANAASVRLQLPRRADADVIVVGGGPAGAATAAHLARAGWRTLVLDRQRFPRDKVCGDFVGPVALVELASLGVSSRPEYRATNVIRRAALLSPSRDRVEHLAGSEDDAHAGQFRRRPRAQNG